MSEAILILDNIRSEHNVGSLFRTADAAGVAQIFLCGYTPAPSDRFGRPSKTIAKVALGAEKTIPWQKCATAISLVRKLKKKKAAEKATNKNAAQPPLIVAIEQSADSVDYKKAATEVHRALRAGRGVAFILGEEVSGMSAALLKEADVVAEIPMRGSKESLNVSVAGGIALFRMLGI